MAKRIPAKLSQEEAARNLAAVLERQRELTKDLDPEEIERFVTEIVEEVRQEMYEEGQRNRSRTHRH